MNKYLIIFLFCCKPLLSLGQSISFQKNGYSADFDVAFDVLEERKSFFKFNKEFHPIISIAATINFRKDTDGIYIYSGGTPLQDISNYEIGIDLKSGVSVKSYPKEFRWINNQGETISEFLLLLRIEDEQKATWHGFIRFQVSQLGEKLTITRVTESKELLQGHPKKIVLSGKKYLIKLN